MIEINGSLYFLNKQPFESDEDAYWRLWYLINNNKDVSSDKDICESKKELNKLKNMIY